MKNQPLRKLKKNRKFKCVIFIFNILIISIIVLGCNFAKPQFSKSKTLDVKTKYYTSIIVEEGESLWTIANYYLQEGDTDISNYIKEIKKVNCLTEDNIHAGQYLTVPYYN